MSVDFPEPDGPMIAVKLPRSNPMVTPRSASTAVLPWPYRLTSSWPLTATPEGCSMAGGAMTVGLALCM